MPTKKPVIQTVIEENIYNKFKEICKKEDRSESKMAAIIIKNKSNNTNRKTGESIIWGYQLPRLARPASLICHSLFQCILQSISAYAIMPIGKDRCSESYK